MTKFLIEVEQFDDHDQLVVSLGNADEDGEMYSSVTVTDIEDDDMMMQDSVYLVSQTMEWDELAKFLISYAPQNFIPDLTARIMRERDHFESRLIDAVLEK